MLNDILGSRSYIVKNYIDKCTALVKSMLICCHDEAGLYNDQITAFRPNFTPSVNKTNWRYYKHLAGIKYTGDSGSIDDVPIYLTSLDTGANIELSRTVINSHPMTKKALLKFDHLIENLYARYPGYNVYILACLLPVFYTAESLPTLANFTMVSHHVDLVEPNEVDLIHRVNEFIDNYQVTWMISYYALADTLFLAAQYAVFYLALVNKVIAIRLSKAKTAQAHSFHIENYLASHHSLDLHLNQMTDKQKHFLYKNILYLDNHVGRQDIFDILAKVLFEERDITLCSYVYRQKTTLTTLPNLPIDPITGVKPTYQVPDVDYVFSRGVLTNNPNDLTPETITLTELRDKEISVNNKNLGEWVSEFNRINIRLQTSISGKLLTKDLVSMMTDTSINTDKTLTSNIINYWGYYVSKGLLSFNVPVTNVTTNIKYNLANRNAYKLLIAAILLKNGFSLTAINNTTHIETIPLVYNSFPIVNINSVLLDRLSLTSTETMLNRYCSLGSYQKKEVDNIMSFSPRYLPIKNIESFYKFLMQMHLTNIAFWLYTSNLNDQNDNAEMTRVITAIHTNTTLDINNNESVVAFLNRIGFGTIVTLWNNYNHYASITQTQTKAEAYQALHSFLDDLIMSILDTAFDNNYKPLFDSTATQQAMVNIFQTLTSYDTRFIEIRNDPTPILANMPSMRNSVSDSLNIGYLLDNIFTSNGVIFDQLDINVSPLTPPDSPLDQSFLQFFLPP